MDRRMFLGVTLAGLVPLIGCGGGKKKSTGGGDGSLKNSLANAITPTGRLIGGLKTVGANSRAWLWTGGLTGGEDLHPSGFLGSSLDALSDDGRVLAITAYNDGGTGFIESQRALIRRDGAVIPFHPTGYAWSRVDWVSADGALVRGKGRKPGDLDDRPLEWKTSDGAASVVDLSGRPGYDFTPQPPTSGDGSAVVNEEGGKAALWRSGAKTLLHQATMRESGAGGISRNGRFQVGGCSLPGDSEAYNDGLPVYNRAMVWEGTAASARSLHPADWYSTAATHISNDGNFVAGVAKKTSQFTTLFAEELHVVIWRGTPESMVDLHATLPANFVGSFVNGIDDAGNIVGSATDSDSNVWAVYWTVA